MDSIIYWLLAAAYAAILGAGIGIWRCDGERGFRYLLFALTAALLWDNAVLGAGKWIGKGTLLEGMNLTRYWLHALVTPLLAIVSLDLLRETGFRWARRPAAWVAGWAFAIALIGWELASTTLRLELRPRLEYGALSYTAAHTAEGPPWMVILVMLPLLVAGIGLWRRGTTSALLWGTVAMAIGGAIPLPLDSGATTNVFELILVISLWTSVYRANESANRRAA